MNELDFIVDLHQEGERQGPGSTEESLRALACIETAHTKGIKVADLGCGSGGQTMTLAQHIEGKIVAVDLFPAFLAKLDADAKKLGLESIQTLEASMEDLPFGEEEFDVIWSEGAIYNMGFEAGIKKWRNYLKKDGYLAVSEMTWISHSRPKEIEDFWKAEYPEIDTASAKIKLLEENGYVLVGYFVLSEDSWLKNYYEPMEARFSAFLKRHGHSEMAQKVVEAHQAEIELYKKYKAYYSYGFYIAKKG